jgi:hypothetical protein
MEECLEYFRRAIRDPQSVPPWSEWWAANEALIERVFPLVNYVRIKHRKLRGAIQILQIAGELPKDYTPPSPLFTGSCGECGERTTEHPDGSGGGHVSCPNCGIVLTYDFRPGPTA